MRTAQQLFDTVVAHLRNQNSKAEELYKNSMRCVYRTDDGKKCAVGCLINDSVYSPFMEGKTLDGLLANYKIPSPLHKEFTANSMLLARLQSIHDNHNIDTWEQEFAQTAEDFELQYTPKETT